MFSLFSLFFLISSTFYSHSIVYADESKMDKIQILFSHDGMGELEPCGCRGNPLGGLLRRGALVEGIKKEYFKTIQVDSGNTFFENTITPEGLKKSLKIQSEKIAESFKLLPIQYFTPGDKDFSLGVSHLKKLKSISKSIFLSANIVDLKNKILFKDLSVVQLKKKKIIFIGITGEDLELPESLKVNDPISTIKKIIDKNKVNLKKDIVIILSQCGMEKDKKIAEHFKDLSLIIGSRDQLFTQNPIKIEQTILLQTSYRNQYLGKAIIDLNSKKIESELIPLEESLEKKTPVSYKKIIEDWKNKINLLEKSEKNKINFSQLNSSPSTITKCFQCHEEIFNFWRKTPHALALTTLKEKNLLNHPDCLRCHAVKTQNKISWEENELLLAKIHKADELSTPIEFLKNSPPKPIRDTLNELEEASGGVQCENCHIIQENHPFSGIISKEVSEKTCIKCHNKERAPLWYNEKGLNQLLFIEKKKRIRCPQLEK